MNFAQSRTGEQLIALKARLEAGKANGEQVTEIPPEIAFTMIAMCKLSLVRACPDMIFQETEIGKSLASNFRNLICLIPAVLENPGHWIAFERNFVADLKDIARQN